MEFTKGEIETLILSTNDRVDRFADLIVECRKARCSPDDRLFHERDKARSLHSRLCEELRQTPASV